VVDDYDGVFQHLNLEAGAHHSSRYKQTTFGRAPTVVARTDCTITYRATSCRNFSAVAGTRSLGGPRARKAFRQSGLRALPAARK
jgi:hypothetical protein